MMPAKAAHASGLAFGCSFPSQIHVTLIFLPIFIFHDSLLHLWPRGLPALTCATLLPGMPFPRLVAAALSPPPLTPATESATLAPSILLVTCAQLLYTVKEGVLPAWSPMSHLVNAPTDGGSLCFLVLQAWCPAGLLTLSFSPSRRAPVPVTPSLLQCGPCALRSCARSEP